MASSIPTEHLKTADYLAVRDANQSGQLTRLFHRVTTGYRKALSKDPWQTVLLTAAVVFGIPMTMEAVAFGIMPHIYLGMTVERIGGGFAWVQQMRELLIRECVPFLALTYLVQPGGWDWSDLESLQTLQIGSGKPHATFNWIPPQTWLTKALMSQKTSV